jgi:nuclear pore complex protein Nup188
LSASLGSNDAITKQMLQVAQQCLNSNQVVPGPESIFLKVVDARANLALILSQRLARVKLPLSDVYGLLTTVVGTIHGVEDPFSSDSIAYYRTLLKALFVTLRAHPKGDGSDNGNETEGGTTVDIIQIVLNILDRVVGRGFRSLVSLIHDNEAIISPEDLALLTAILQACLSLPTIDQSQTQILNIMASHKCVYAATSLFSWADKLAIQGDPVYGELSVLFLLELSALPLLAEQMACDGVLSNLLSANLTKYMLKSNVSPYSEALVAQRCYGIWAKGLLPIMLNLLTALGGTVAPEVAYVLNQFTHLLHLSVDRLEAPGASRTQTRSSPHYLTLIAVSEINSLALLTRILSALRINNNRDIPAVVWDSAAVLENVEFWLSSDRLLKERLLPLGSRELEWRGMKIGDKGSNVLEDKIISQLEAVREVLSEEVEDE